ncbi:MAG: 6-bladed beta-propeller [Candidatus Mcinerneyibacterium aminivorans]|uniref:6-bladed beta-propeller n=1 Tax=Candidatus Mcinerneyibacterium aminivorans TaxID=2703815 RepID=A0A5D0MJG2_9BACT|nr:MAG: 6-bladed beta-propeller [Candidatus Mcinerneyibacterium aminivorans]
MFRKLMLTFIVILFLFAGCQKAEEKEAGSFEELDKIKLEKPMSITSMVFANNKIVAFNQGDKTIYLLDLKGNVIDKYKKIGKGPGEFTTTRGVNLLGYSRYLYVIDGMTNKIMKFNLDKKIDFVDEYYIEVSQVSPVGFVDSKENIYLATMISDHVILKVNSNGEIINKFLKKEKESFENMNANQIRDYLVSNLYYPIIQENTMVLTGFLSKKLKFYKKQNDNFKLLKETEMQGLKGNVYKSETRESSNKRSVSIEGIGYIGSWIHRDKYLVGVSKHDFSESFVNCFNLNGKFIGNIELERDINKKYESMFFNKKQDRFFYQVSRRKNEKEDYELDTDYLYIGKLEVYE